MDFLLASNKSIEPSHQQVMKLNVGGSFYTTTKPTLLTVPGSVLHQIACGAQYCPRDDRGNYVIDRDGHAFRSRRYHLRVQYTRSALRNTMPYWPSDEQFQADAVDHILESRRKRARGRRWNGAARKLSASVGENLNNFAEDDEGDLDFFEDSWIGGN
ncbi:BTB/POZ domain-containing protein KCTD4 [Elysia marginata]|uniref:BTB/POZ domain-containing protein KCTD4 n=1 Tax=Elysia marginata TaxID=1093978 RepID=A0AAV4G1M7_9GAST|nr:BTB/POZ domain-containing protein KCTD4 [Elysia marginata]